MKSFDDWFEENKKDGDVKWRLERSWKSAQEVQRESDAEIVMFAHYNTSSLGIANEIRNNKAV